MKSVNKVVNKTALAMILSVAGATASMSAIANMSDKQVFTHKIEVEASNDDNVNVFVNSNGDMQEFIISKDEINNKEDLMAALATLPDEIRDTVIASLSNLDSADHFIKLHKEEHSPNVFQWVDKGKSPKVFVIEKDKIYSGTSLTHKVHKYHIVEENGDVTVKVKDGGSMHTDLITRLLKKGKFTQEELDKLQQALDEKR